MWRIPCVGGGGDTRAYAGGVTHIQSGVDDGIIPVVIIPNDRQIKQLREPQSTISL